MNLGKIKMVMVEIELIDGQLVVVELTGEQIKGLDLGFEGLDGKKKGGKPGRPRGSKNKTTDTQSAKGEAIETNPPAPPAPAARKSKGKGEKNEKNQEKKQTPVTDSEGYPLEGLRFVEYTSNNGARRDYLVRDTESTGRLRLWSIDTKPRSDGRFYAWATGPAGGPFGFTADPAKCRPANPFTTEAPAEWLPMVIAPAELVNF